MIRLDNVTKLYGNTQAVVNVSLEIPDGEVCELLADGDLVLNIAVHFPGSRKNSAACQNKKYKHSENAKPAWFTHRTPPSMCKVFYQSSLAVFLRYYCHIIATKF